ncbi:MAG: hypothetical protein JW793_08495 [Acidobacteria bacterium]|nr:hypothetical protein [Acidobacteriota bacterium]
MLRRCLFIFAFLAAALPFGASQGRTKRKGPVVRQADRILIESGGPEALFNFFADTLRLPVAWPLAARQDYTSGGVSTGDIVLEIYRYGKREDGPASARYAGLSCEPYPLEDALQELRIIGIPYDAPEQHISTLPDGTEGTAYTTVNLPSLSHPTLPVSFIEYSDKFLQVSVRRKQWGNRLLLNGGGPLGIRSTHAIVLESANFKKDEAEWIRLLGKPDADGCLHAVLGPAFRIVPGSKSGIERIVLRVQSLTRAEAFLKEHALLGKEENGEIFLKPSAVQELAISLVETPADPPAGPAF